MSSRDPGHAGYAGRTVGPYLLVERLGRGGMGEVWLAEDPTGASGGAPRRVALKLLDADRVDDPAARARFSREVQAARRVRGPTVAALLDADVEAAQPWLAAAYVAGPTLAEHVVAHGALGDLSLRALGSSLAAALVSIHAAGVVHRDLTPRNVVLGPDGPRVVDFGIARYDGATAVTEAGARVGTPAWMAPERLTHDEITPAGDVWSWGAVMAYAALGHPAVGGSGPDVVAYRILRGQVDLVGVPSWLEPWVAASLAVAPGERPTPVELVAAMAGDLPPPAAPPTSAAAAAPDARPTEGRSEPAGPAAMSGRSRIDPPLGPDGRPLVGIDASDPEAASATTPHLPPTDVEIPPGAGVLPPTPPHTAVGDPGPPADPGFPPTAPGLPPTAPALPPTGSSLPPASGSPPSAPGLPPTAPGVPPTAPWPAGRRPDDRGRDTGVGEATSPGDPGVGAGASLAIRAVSACIVLGAAVAVGLWAGLLPVVLVTAVVMVLAVALRLSRLRLPEGRRPLPPTWSVALAGPVMLGTGLSVALGPVLGLVVLVGLVVVFVLLGGDIG